MLIGLIAVFFVYNFPNSVGKMFLAAQDAGTKVSSVILAHNPKTILALRSNYLGVSGNVQKKVRILIVPGHDPFYGGTEFKDLKEREIVADLGNYLEQYLKKDSHFDVVLSRDVNAWSSTFVNYFNDNWSAIKDWQKASHQEMSYLISVGGAVKPTPKVFHNDAPKDVALRLYGVTKWANENDADIVIHLHLNDYPGHGNRQGVYSGFSIYVPGEQYLNSTTTKAVAQKIFNRLEKNYSVSNLPGESSGIVDELELIAIGANNTADAASMLIEYGYIYEPKFATASVQSLTLQNMAYQTYLGLKDFFEQK